MNIVRLVFVLFLIFAFEVIQAQADCTRYYFDGQDDLITLPKALNDKLVAGAFTIEMWIQGDLEDEQSNNPTLLSNRSSQQGLSFYFKEKTTSSDGKILAVSFNGVEYFDSNCPIILDGECHHIAVKRFVDRLYFYLDGDQIYQIPIPTDLGFQSALPLTIGHDQVDFFGSRFQGYIDELKIWSVPLSAIVIKQQYYRELFFEEAGLLAQYRFAEDDGIDFLDDSGNDYNGYLGDGEWEDSQPIRSTSCCQITIDIKDFSKEHFVVYPNPADDFIHIRSSNLSLFETDQSVLIQYYDINGISLLSQQFNGDNVSFDISSLPSGMYFLKIDNGRQIDWQKLIIR